MVKKYKNRYRIDSNRCEYWDYSSPGFYFLTLMVKNRKHILGKVVDGEMILSKYGKIVQEELSMISDYHPLAKLDVSVVMPNHVHMIISISNQPNNNPNHHTQHTNVTQHDPIPQDDPNINHPLHSQHYVERIHEFSLQPQSTKQYRTSRRKMIIPKIVGKFQMLTSKKINQGNKTPGIKNWQYNYHDHIIRDKMSYYRITQYILNNPRNWKTDRFYR